jgi:translation initiation factor 1
MNKKLLNAFSALVFSTNPDAIKEAEPESTTTPSPKEQRLKVRIEKKHRGGKTVTVIDGFIGNEDDFQELAKRIKTKCGTGGSAKDGEIIIQGENREKIIPWLKEWGYTQTKG